MNSPLDWDYADLKRRMQTLKAPPFTDKNGKPGNHCDYCTIADEQICPESCRAAYKKRYGVEPP